MDHASASVARARECLKYLNESNSSVDDINDILARLQEVVDVMTTISGLIPPGDESTMVAVLDRDWLKVEGVYINQVAVKDGLALKSKAAVSAALKNGTKCQGRRLKMWTDLEPALKADFLSRGRLPPQADGRGTAVYALRPDGTVIEAFRSISDAAQKMKIARETVVRSCESSTPYNGVQWSLTPPNH